MRDTRASDKPNNLLKGNYTSATNTQKKTDYQYFGLDEDTGEYY